jgi:hypothetical protein
MPHRSAHNSALIPFGCRGEHAPHVVERQQAHEDHERGRSIHPPATSIKPLTVANVCLYHLGVDLTSKPRGGGHSTFDGRDRPALRLRDEHFRPLDDLSRAVGVRSGGWTLDGPFKDAAAAMAAADEYVAAHLARDDGPPTGGT